MATEIALGDRIRNLRVRQFLTQDELAEAAGVGKATVARLEAGSVRPHMQTIRAIAAALKVEPSVLVDDPGLMWARRNR